MLTLALTCSESSGLKILKHSEYVRNLPNDVITTLHFRRRELEQLRSTALHGSALARRKHTRQLCKSALQFVEALSSEPSEHAVFERRREGIRTWATQNLERLKTEPPDESALEPEEEPNALQLWRWAETAYLSRNFPPRLGFPGVEADVMLKGEHWPGEVMGAILIPGLDSINHRRGEKAHWLARCSDSTEVTSATDRQKRADEGSCSDGDHIVLMLETRYEAEEQIFNNYGAKTNEELLGSYGFTIPGGPDDAVSLLVGGGGAGDDGKAGERRPTYWRRDTETIPDALYDSIIEQLGMEAEEVPEGVSAREAARTDLECQLNVCEQLAEMFARKAAALGKLMMGGDDHSESGELPIRPEVQVHIKEYLKGEQRTQCSLLDTQAHYPLCLIAGQREICESAAERMEERLEQLERQWQGGGA